MSKGGAGGRRQGGRQPTPQVPQRPAPDEAQSQPPTRRLPVVAVGASAGGLEALQAFFSHMPEDCGVAFVVITHVRPERPSLLPELIAHVTPLKVIAGTEHTLLAPNTVVVAKDSLLTVRGGILGHVKDDGELEVSHHPVDHFFRALAEDQGEHAIAVILSGSGNDGALGAKAVKAVGGMVMAQTPDSAKYPGMPTSVIEAGLADYVLPPEEMPAALVEYCRGPFLRLGQGPEPPLLPEDAIRTILLRLRARTGHDFTCYKKSTISRRIHRRMNVKRIDEPQAYLRYLQEHGEELDLLLQDLLISVTSFFRDPDAFAALADVGIPRLLADRDNGETLRAWVAGCATGEEAYSVAILLTEAIRKANRVHQLQMFATDLDSRAIDMARHGLYPAAIAADVPKDLLARYFTAEDNAFRIRKTIRDAIVFAVQNLVSDPPFTRMDLVVCRNVLIYLDTRGQQRVLPTVHYALRPGGLLFLGSSESLGDAAELFDTLDARHKVLRRKESPRNLPIALRVPPGPPAPQVSQPGDTGDSHQLGRAVERLLLERFAPCSIVVDHEGVVVWLHGPCGRWLQPEQGQPRNRLADMVREGAARALSSALAEARETHAEVVRGNLQIRTNGGIAKADLTVTRLPAPEVLRGMLLVTITPMATPPPSALPAEVTEEEATGLPSREELEQELRFTRESLSTTIEELQTANEELRSSNEELQSTNEELHSGNEELETSREEMQSLNEELNTVNAELQSKVDALSRANDDMLNLLNSTQVATIFLDAELRVKRYTDRARDLVRLIESDIGRPLSDLTSSLHYDALVADCRRVLDTLVPMEREVADQDGHWHLVRLMPYRRADNLIDGLVLTVVDIDRSKQAERRARAGRDYFESIVQTVREPLLMLDGELRVQEANDGFYQVFGSQPKHTVGRPIHELGDGRWDSPALRQLLERVREGGRAVTGFRLEQELPQLGRRVFLVNGRRIATDDENEPIILAFEDVTARESL